MIRKITYLYLGLLIFCNYGWAQTQENAYYPDGDPQVEWISEPGSDVTVGKEYYPEGMLKSETPYKNGQIHGAYREYGRSRILLAEVYYRRGVKHGPYKMYSDSGKMLSQGNNREGMLYGLQKSFDDQGHRLMKGQYKNDQPHGIVKMYYPDGTLKEQHHYRGGKLWGPARFYYPNGQLSGESHYENDQRQGIEKIFYENGKLKSRINFVNDQIEGAYDLYYENGILKNKDVLQSGKVIKREAYDENGAFVKDLSFPTEDIDHKIIEAVKTADSIFKNKFWVLAVLIYLLIVFVTVLRIRTLNKKEHLLKDINVLKPADHKKSNERQEPPATIVSKEVDFNNIKQEFNVLHVEHEKVYRRLVETIKSGIFISDIKGNIIYANNTFSRMFGYQTKQEVMGFNLNDEWARIDHKGENVLEKIGSSNMIQDFQFRYLKKDGLTVVLSANINRIYDDRGEAVGFQGVVLDNTEKSQLGEAVLAEKRKLELILQFFENINSIRELEKLLDFSVVAISDILESQTCFIVLEDAESKMLRIQGAKGLEEEVLKTAQVQLEDSIVGCAMKNGTSMLVKNIDYDDRFSNISRPSYMGRSFVIVPVKYKDEVVGTVHVTNRRSKLREEIPFNETDLKVLEIIAGKLSNVMENIKFYDDLNLKNVTDPITNVYNYRLLSESLDREIRKYKRDKKDFFLFMMDVDNFKSYNDTFGHLEGDELLKNLGIILKDQVREADIVCRYAGDEFCVLLFDTNSEDVIKPAKKIVSAVEQFPFKRTVTISIGIAGYQEGMAKKEFISKADQALYEAKHKGKNQVAVFK